MSAEAIEIVLRDGRHVVLREMTPDDAPAMSVYLARLSPTAPYIVVLPDEVPTPEEYVERIRRYADRPGSLALVAHEPDTAHEIIADCGILAGQHRQLRHTTMLGMSVLKEWRGSGLGRAMLERVIAWARARESVWRIELGVMHTNDAAIRLYESVGFVPEGRRRRMFRQPDGTLLDDISMALWVGPEPPPVQPH